MMKRFTGLTFFVVPIDTYLFALLYNFCFGKKENSSHNISPFPIDSNVAQHSSIDLLSLSLYEIFEKIN
jgi:hypothetical protein